MRAGWRCPRPPYPRGQTRLGGTPEPETDVRIFVYESWIHDEFPDTWERQLSEQPEMPAPSLLKDVPP